MKFKRQAEKHSLMNLIYDIMIALVIVLIITNFLAQNMRVVGSSMAPLLNNKDMVIINKLAYNIKSPKKNDIIVFLNDTTKEKFVKRIIGTAGDIIDYHDHMIYVNNSPIEQLQIVSIRARGDIDYPIVVPPNTYFVLGDNYNNSIDSRYTRVGFVGKDRIVGKVSIRIWPLWTNILLKL